MRFLLIQAALAAIFAQLSPQLRAGESPVPLHPEELELPAASTAALRAAIAAGEWTSAESILFDAANSNPGSPSALRALGIAHYQAGRYFLAGAALKKADALVPLDPEARFLLAAAFIRVDRRHWARAELETLVAKHGASASHQLALARIHYDQGQFAAALSRLDSLLEAVPDWAAAHDLRGQSLEGLGRKEAAAAAYEKAIALSPEKAPAAAWPRYHLGSLLHDEGRLEAAEAALATAVSLDREHAPAQRELGVVYLKAGKFKLAAKALERAAELSPLDAAVQYSLVAAYRRLDEQGLAKAALERFRQITE